MPKVRSVFGSQTAHQNPATYLPPYSPDFNPIENLWSKVKEILRSLAPRTSGELLKAAGIAFAAISLADCKGFFLNAKYAT